MYKIHVDRIIAGKEKVPGPGNYSKLSKSFGELGDGTTAYSMRPRTGHLIDLSESKKFPGPGQYY